MDIVIENVTVDETGIDITVDGRRLRLSWMWLRDHARDESSYLHAAHQRLVTPSEVRNAGSATVEHTPRDVTVTWVDGPAVVFDAALLAALESPTRTGRLRDTDDPWIGSELRDRICRLDHDEFTAADDGVRRALDSLWRDGVIVLAEVPLDPVITREVLERFGYVRRTIFGDMWEFSSDGGFDDTASTPLEITPHTDGTYSHDAPGLLGLHCIDYEATGGENVFVDAHTVASRLSGPSHAILCSTEIPGQYIGDGAHLVARRPALRYEGDTLTQVSYNHHDRAPFVLPEPAMTELYDALHEFDSLANDPDLQFELAMRPGDMVIFDNWRVLHGRRAFLGRRLIAGGYVNREDVESTTRRLAATTRHRP